MKIIPITYFNFLFNYFITIDRHIADKKYYYTIKIDWMALDRDYWRPYYYQNIKKYYEIT